MGKLPANVFLLLLCILFLYRVAIKVEALSPDGQALVNLRTAIISSDSVLLQWRPEDEDPCGWKGVTCDRQSKRVTAFLPNHKLSGSIASDIGTLGSLQFLALYGNNLYGAILPELGNCTQLQSADLSINSLSGSIPSSLGRLSKLSTFNVSTNFVVGLIPSGGVLVNFQNDSFVGNRELCGKQIQICRDSNGSPASSQPSDAAKKKYSGRLLVSALLLAHCFWLDLCVSGVVSCIKDLVKKQKRGLGMDVCGDADP